MIYKGIALRKVERLINALEYEKTIECKGRQMSKFKLSNFIKFIRIFTIIISLPLIYKYSEISFLTMFFLVLPYVFIMCIASEELYQTKTRLLLRSSANIVVLLLAIGLLFGIKADAQAGIGVMFAILIQYGVIFVSEAVIGLLSVEETH